MKLSDAQIRGRIKNIAKENDADPRVLMRLYMMERFLERVSTSAYRDYFVIKGGVLITSMLGVKLCTTMDIDTTILRYDLSISSAEKMISSICNIDISDGVTFSVKSVSEIMDDMEYPGIRFALEAHIGRMITPIKIDVSTGAVITPSAIEYDYKLMLEERSISILSYNLETVLAEKLQTILSRGILNTRMRDFYDVHVLLMTYKNMPNQDNLREAFVATCHKRHTEEILNKTIAIYNTIANDENLLLLWSAYRNKFSYARDISFVQALESLKSLIAIVIE